VGQGGTMDKEIMEVIKMLKSLWIFNNGLCACFNEYGEQIPLLQGDYKEKLPEIKKAITPETIIKDCRSDWQ